MIKKSFIVLVVLFIIAPLNIVGANSSPALQLQITGNASGGGGGSPNSGNNGFTSDRTPIQKEQRLSLPFVEEIHCAFYDSYSLAGKLTDPQQNLSINGSSTGITYTTDQHFQALLPLTLGDNLFYLQGFAGNDESPRLDILIHRQGFGDSNDDTIVDDYDLSLVASNWGNGNCTTDFNQDSVVDDYDLSILASHWNLTY